VGTAFVNEQQATGVKAPYHLEKGQAEPQRRTIRKIAGALGVEPTQLVKGSSNG
jgi:transcriptional regulator with XRE-family HTH domain